MKEISILIGGKAGDGIKQGGNAIARLLNRMGYWVFLYEDYPSLIRGGHNFAIIRASSQRMSAHKDKVDVLIALNQETLDIHKDRIKKDTIIIFDSDKIDFNKGVGISMSKFAQENDLPEIVRNVISLGILAKVLGIGFGLVEEIIESSLKVKIKENIEVAKLGYKRGERVISLEKLNNIYKPLLTGNEAISLGAVKAGLRLYVAYPMTPASSILHFLAANEDELNIRTIHPENEISAVLITEGAAYAGVKSMVGTSGGGFALMVESLSLAGQAEIPIMFVLAQRVGPSSGVPTYTMQSDLLFAIHAGHGDFEKIIAAPGDIGEAFSLSGQLLNLAWKFQVPVILLTDKHLSESTFSFSEGEIKEMEIKEFNGKGEYLRYKITEDGVSPLAFPGFSNVVKSISYEHDEKGLTTEESKEVVRMIDKRMRKKESIIQEMKKMKVVKSYGKKSKKALICWGSTIGAVKEVGEELNLKVIQPLYLEPFPVWEMEKELKGIDEIIVVENNSTGQLAKILECHGIKVNGKILKYDGRPFTVDELKEKLCQKI